MTTTRSDRRKFLKSASVTSVAASGVVTLGGVVPALWSRAAAAAREEERVLVVVEMAGGNDGLNTVVPFRDPRYRKARPTLAFNAADVLKIDNETGFHPALRGFADLLESGRLAVVQGVGYENPNRSHFESMDIWHTCQRKNETRTDGWLGRFLERTAQQSQTDPAAIHIGAEKQPFALMSRKVRVPSISSLEEFRLRSRDEEGFRRKVQELTAARRTVQNDLLGFVQSSTASAIAASQRIESAHGSYRPVRSYPTSDLANRLQTVSQLIDAGLHSMVYYVRIDGFDTHARQAGAHQSLLRQVSDAVSVFLDDLQSHGHGSRVVCLCFSEFGRRVAENASEGTDHGTAGPVFLAGQGVRAGLIGAHPDLGDLQDGDLKHHTDFRQVYAAVLEKWLGCPSRDVLLGEYRPVDAFELS